MVSEAHVMCVTAGFLGEKTFFVPKTEFFGFIGKFSNFFWIWSIKKVILTAVFLHKFHTWEKSGSWDDMGQNALSQSDCKIFKLTVSLEGKDENVWFFACWYEFMEIKSWSKNIGVGGVVKNGCGHSGLRTLKSAVSQEGISWINLFLACW